MVETQRQWCHIPSIICKARVGGVLHDAKDQVVMVATQPELHRDDPLKMELLAILHGL